ncbi:MAG: AMP-binding protein [Lachnospiraceae bacterium]|nr:AMP-binding protein [Lachnospiraceae bacterium]
MEPIQESIKYSLKKYADNIAIAENELSIKYSDIERKAGLLAGMLIQQNIDEQTRFVLMFKDRINYIISIISVLYLRGIFIPVDVSLPKGRIKQIIQESHADYIICDDVGYEAEFQKKNIKLLVYSWKMAVDSMEEMCLPDYRYKCDDSIYIYFTSGTTGRPKGVIGRNKGLKHFIDWEIKEFNIKEKSKFAQITSPSFDPYLRDIFVPLLSGGTICIMDNCNSFHGIKFLHQWMERNEINIIHCVPSIFHVIAMNICKTKNKMKSLKYIFLAGERIVISDLKIWYGLELKHINLVSLYGPTETTLAKMFHRISEYDILYGEVPLGIPISETNIYLLNKNDYQSNYGEICIETQYCSLGYVDICMNEEKFLDSPFNDNIKLYRTGDFGQLNSKGEILFRGRKDRQIKLSGMSANLFAIEQRILEKSTIEQCFLKLNTLNNRIICYYSAQNEINVKEINDNLSYYFQDVFIPQQYIKLKEFKRNSNGKIDINDLMKHID